MHSRIFLGICVGTCLGFALVAFSCHTTDFLLYRELRYNFTSEGFLSPDVLQTIGKARLPEDAPLALARKLCQQEARRLAENRMLRVFLHTKHRLPPSSSNPSLSGSTFDADYPVRFGSVELAEARSDFAFLLRRAYVALKDDRSRKQCLLVLRLSGRDLPSEIRRTPLGYRKLGRNL